MSILFSNRPFIRENILSIKANFVSTSPQNMDNLTKEQRRKNMQNIRSNGTVPERLIYRELRIRGIYFAKHVDSITGKPDVVFRRKKVVVFIDSDFWHGHSRRFIMPKTNVEYWQKKIERNKKRDRAVTCELKERGWKVLRIWEYDVKHNINNCTKKIMKAIDLSFKS